MSDSEVMENAFLAMGRMVDGEEAVRLGLATTGVLLDPERRRLHVVHAGDSADYGSLQPSLTGFLPGSAEGPGV
jgi:hypothetical protein